MNFMGLNDLRETFLKFFEERGHDRLPSFSLVPRDDKSLLLINSGMAPMKKYFVGETPPSNRVTTCQKCIRTVDIENVGYTSRHLTYFEMLGNFSFGDYFKEQAIPWAWTFFTETLSIPPELLYISVYQDDDEAYDIWTQQIGIPADHMVRLGKEDNFWEHGSGPCGPSSEIYFDRGEDEGCGKPDCAPGCDCDRFIEIGNIVFTQFESDGKGNYTKIEHPNIDFGMGLERLACVMQNVENVFMVDTMKSIMAHVKRLAGVKYGENPHMDTSLKIITDHIRSITFMVGDGVLGSNEGRGYVLRRLARRAARHGKILGLDGPFLYQVVDTVIEENRSAYPELVEKREIITRVIRNEEESFSNTIDQGLAVLNKLIDQMETKSIFTGENAFLLNDTYGFPLDLTKEILSEQGIKVDEARFLALMREQRERARNARKQAGEDAWANEADAAEGFEATAFIGYDGLTADTKVLAVIQNGEKKESAGENTEGTVILAVSPFYAESGGQVADTGVIKGSGVEARVLAVTKTDSGVYLHRVKILTGMLYPGMEVRAEVDQLRRHAIMRNHTAAHLLQAALRRVLGEHVEQAGQWVDDKRVRFDFTHFSAMTPEELTQVEVEVNQLILQAIPMEICEMPIQQAKEIGAMALFGEKYGDIVRVVSIGEYSRELCGGTHVSNTSNLGLFRILSETSVASGVRRIEGVTGAGFLKVFQQHEALLHQTAGILKVNTITEVPARAEQLLHELHDKNKSLEKLNARMATANVEDLFKDAREIDGVKVITGLFSGIDIEALKTMCDRVRDHDVPVVAVFAGVNNGKLTLCATASQKAQKKGAKAGLIVKEVALLTGGNGGGRPDFAMAGARDPEKVDEALSRVVEIVKNFVEKAE